MATQSSPQVRLFIPFTPSVPDVNGLSPIMSDPKEKFFRHFQVEISAIQDRIDDLATLSPVGGERQGCMDAILTGISRLNNEVIDAGEYIPSYDQRTYSQAIKALTEKFNEASGKFKPKSRFQFKPRGNKAADATPGERAVDPRLRNAFSGSTDGCGDKSTSAVIDDDQPGDKEARAETNDSLSNLPSFPKNYNEELAQPGGRGVRKPSFSTAKNIAIHDHTGLHIMLPASASHATASGSLTSLRGCIVDMTIPTSSSASGVPFAGLALRDVSNSLIVAGHVSGATHITNLRDSVVVVAARQVRIHECHNVDVYLHCGSHPIIEDCDGMRFAPLPSVYTSQEDGPNQWDQVDDFKWLKNEASPNWQVLPEAERVANDVWTKDVGGNPSLSTGDILRKVGITPPASSGSS